MARYALVLAGGRSTRMGRDKATLRRDGRTLLAEVVEAAARFGPVVVVGPAVRGPAVPGPVLAVTREDPPFGGPVAAIAAGVAVLPAGAGAVSADAGVVPDEVLVLACDLPGAAILVDVLLHADADGDVLCAVDGADARQLLAARYRLPALRTALARVEPHGLAVRQLVDGLSVHEVAVPDGAADDVDDPAAAARHGLH